MKLPLRVDVFREPDFQFAIWDADGCYVVIDSDKEVLEYFATLANSHAATPSEDRNVEGVRTKLLERSQVGLKKYGCTTCTNPLSAVEWLNHLQQELMDGAVYIEQLLHSHAATPGAPREDGSWIIRTEGGQEHIAYKRVEIRGKWYWECSSVYAPEEVIVAHRRHTPLEVKQ